MEIGLYTFGHLSAHPMTGQAKTARQRLEEIVEAARLADEVGLDVFGVGEHHRLDFAVSSPPVVLAAIAQATKRIKLASAVTVLSTSDPVRVFEDFATLDLLSGGRAEIIAGRGAFVESFPLFGYDTNDYNELFAEKLDLLLQLNQSERITWQGNFRTALKDAEIAPRPANGKLAIWAGVGRTPDSAIRAGTLGLPMNLAVLGPPARIAPMVDLYRKAGAEVGFSFEQLPVATSSLAYIQQDGETALDEFYPYYVNYVSGISRGMSGPHTGRAAVAMNASPEGALFVGGAQQIIEKLRYQRTLFNHQRFMAQIDIGGLPFERVAEAIRILGTEVAPVLRQDFAKES